MRKNHLLNYCLLSLAFLFLILPIGLASTTTQEPNLVKNMANSGEPIDMIRTAVSGSHLLLGDGNGNFNYVGWSDWIGGLGIALGDLNKDGLLDYVLATYDIPYGEPNVVCLGITDTSFDCAYIDDIYEQGKAVALGDVNNDGKLDAVFTSDPGVPAVRSHRVCIGDGDGGFSCHQIGPIFYADDVALGDVNNDGNLDAVFAADGHIYNPHSVCLGAGNGNFTCQQANDSQFGGGFEIALGDINNDGDLDAVFADSYSTYSACLGDGSGEFVCSLGPNGNSNWAIALGDLNEDGNLDAVLSAGLGNHSDKVCLGDGSGEFACTNLSVLWCHRNINLADVNGDGHLDVVSTHIFLGDGTGSINSTPVFTVGCPEDIVLGNIAPHVSDNDNHSYLPVVISSN